MDQVTTVIINYQTPNLLERAVNSFHQFYPDLKMVIIDNGSQDYSPELIKNWELSNRFHVEAKYFEENKFHGPAMDYALKYLVKTKYTFLLDSDTETRKKGFLETMINRAEQRKTIYGVGEIMHVNKRGFKDENGEVVLATPFMLLKTDKYKRLTPFEHHGLPTIKNFVQARQAGYGLINFPIRDYIYHKGRGTAEKYGYGLGLKGKLNFILNKMGL